MRRYLDITLQLLLETGKTVTSGTGCEISPTAAVEQAILWDNVVVESGARVRRAVLGDNVKIGTDDMIEDAAVVCASLVEGKVPPAKALNGEVRGDNFVVPLTG
jgi:NDP-sugar pyrophosphorylase family protein